MEPARTVRRRYRAGWLVLAFAFSVFSACGNAGTHTSRFGAYVRQLCETMGPFERDAQKLGRMLGTYRAIVETRRSEQSMAYAVMPVIDDAHHVVATMDAFGAPDISNGRALAAGTIATFAQIEQDDEDWLTELRAGVWVWPTAFRVKRERLRTSVQALMLVGRQIEHLPQNQERRYAMAHSPVCREIFGSIRALPSDGEIRSIVTGTAVSFDGRLSSVTPADFVGRWPMVVNRHSY